MASYDFDLFVIGAGSGGVRAARIAAGHGARVAIAEEYRFGGTCVIRGCVPKKLLVYASRFGDDFEAAAGFGWNVGETSFDWATLIANKDQEIARLEGLYQSGLARAGVEMFGERAVLEGAHSIRLVQSGKMVSADKILIATGGTVRVDPSVPGIEHAITSNEAFHLARMPERVVIVGGGYIAVEFAGIFAGLGAKTTLVYRGPKILRGFDEDLRDILSQDMAGRGVQIVTDQVVVEISAKDEGRRVTLDDGRVLDVDQIMYATGRAPNTQGLGLEGAGVALGDKGEVRVSGNSQSSIANIFAVGDVTDRVALTPVAIREGHAFADSEFGGNPRTADHSLIPTAVFSSPEIGTVGMAEHEARDKFPNVDVYKTQFRTMRATLGGGNERMFMKLLVNGDDQKILGCHIVGPDAAEIVQIVAITMRMGATKADFDSTMALHPSAAEELVTMREKWQPTSG